MSKSPTVELIMRDAMNNANKQKHEYVCLEHIMYVLLENDDVVELCDKSEIDRDQILTDLSNYLNDPESNGLQNPNGSKGGPKKTQASAQRSTHRCRARQPMLSSEP